MERERDRARATKFFDPKFTVNEPPPKVCHTQPLFYVQHAVNEMKRLARPSFQPSRLLPGPRFGNSLSIQVISPSRGRGGSLKSRLMRFGVCAAERGFVRQLPESGQPA